MTPSLARVSFVVALLAAAVVAISWPAGAAPSCDTSWTNAAGGDWNTAANWDNGVPTSSSNACITLDGTYTVSITAAGGQANTLTLGGSSGTQTLSVQSASGGFYCGGADASLTLANGGRVGANGAMRLTSVIGCGNAGEAGLTVSSGTLTNAGTITSDPGDRGGGRTLQGNITNTGTIAINTVTSYNTASTLDNKGTLAIGDATYMLVAASAGATLKNDAGASISNGTGSGYVYLQPGNTFDEGGKTDVNASNPIDVYVDGSALDYTAGGASTIAVRGASTLSGNLSVGQNLIVQSLSGGNYCPGIDSSVTASANFTSFGHITLTSVIGCGNAGEARLTVSSGTLTNYGTITSDPGDRGGARTLQGNISNLGTIAINTVTAYNTAGTLDNKGTLAIGDATYMLVPASAGATIHNDSGGSISNGSGSGYLYLQPGNTFDQGDGTTDTNATQTIDVYVDGSAIHDTGSGASTIGVRGASTLTGDVASGQNLVVQSLSGGYGCPGNDSSLTAPASFTNGGHITLTSVIACGLAGEARLAVSSGTLTNTGTITSEPGDRGGPRTLQGNITNSGTLAINADTGAAGGALLGDGGTTTIADGATLSTPSYRQNAGTTSLVGSGRLQSSSAVDIEGGTLAGSGTVAGDLTNAGEVAPAGTLSVSGGYTQTGAGTLTLSAGTGGHDELAVGGSATLDGALDLSDNGSHPPDGTTFTALTSAARSGTFASVGGPAASGYDVQYGANDVTLVAKTPPPPSATLAIDDVTVEEPPKGSIDPTTADFTVSLSKPLSQTVTVAYATSNGTASAGSDYSATSGVLTFAPGVTQQRIGVDVKGDGVPEPPETFTVRLSNPTPAGVTIARSKGTATILNYDIAIAGVAPPHAGPEATTLTVLGGGFDRQTAVWLDDSNGPGRVYGSHVTPASDGRSLSASFDLRRGCRLSNGSSCDVRPGSVWNVVVWNGHGGQDVLARGFRVDSHTVRPVVSVELAGRPVTRPDVLWSGFVILRNLGNVDAFGTLVQVEGFPEGTPVHVSNVPGQPNVLDLAGERTVTFAVPRVPAGGEAAIPISFVPRGGPHTFAALRPSVLISDSGAGSAPGSESMHATFTSQTTSRIAGTIHLTGAKGTENLLFDVHQGSVPDSPVFGTGTLDGKPSLTFQVPKPPEPGTFSPTRPPARRAKTSSARLHAASVEGFIGAIEKGKDAEEKADAVLGLISDTRHGFYLTKVSDCLEKAGFLAPSGQDHLDGIAHAGFWYSLFGASLNFVEINPAVSTVAGLAADAAKDANGKAWGDALANDMYLWGAGGLGGRSHPEPLLEGLDFKGGHPTEEQTALILKRAYEYYLLNCDPDRFKKPKDRPPTVIEIRTSGDPNDMVGPGGPGLPRWLNGSTAPPYTYTALFENVATASAPASRVVVTDKLDATKLNLASASLGPITVARRAIVPPAGAKSWTTEVDLRPGRDVLLRIEASLNTTTHVARWRFTSLDPETGDPVTDPARGFLPPDKKPPQGEGSVSLTVAPKAGLPTRAKVSNRAVIVFDTNAPISTPTWTNTIDRTPPRSAIKKVEARVKKRKRHGKVKKVHTLRVRWGGTDLGSGIGSFSVYVARGGGGFKLWQFDTKRVTAAMKCNPNATYRFKSVARDLAGNVQGRAAASKPTRCR